MSQSSGKWLRYTFGIGLSTIFLCGALRGIDLNEFRSSVASVSIPWVAALFILIVLSLLVRGWRWLVMLRTTSRHVTLWHVMRAVLICYAANAVFPRSGEALRAISIRWSCGVSLAAVVATVVVERFLDLIWLLLFVGVASIIMAEQIATTYPWIWTAMALATVVCAALLAFLIWLTLNQETAERVMRRNLRMLSSRIADVIAGVVNQFVSGLSGLKTPSSYLPVVISSAILNLGYLVIIDVSFYAFGLNAPPYDLGYSAALVVMAMSSIGMLVPTPGGLGSYHFLFSQTLHVLYSVPEAEALAVATIVHTIATATYLVFGAPAFFVQNLRRYKRDATTVDSGSVE